MSWKSDMRELDKKRRRTFEYTPGELPAGRIITLQGGNRYEVQEGGSLKRLFIEPDEPEQESQ